MKKDDLIILIIGLLLLAGMLITVFFGGAKSLHGVGTLFNTPPEKEKAVTDATILHLCQSLDQYPKTYLPDERKLNRSKSSGRAML
jgi:hypothetical protein